jgi:hypothetical protein
MSGVFQIFSLNKNTPAHQLVTKLKESRTLSEQPIEIALWSAGELHDPPKLDGCFRRS